MTDACQSEVEVETEGNVIAIEVDTNGVATVAIALWTEALETNEADMSHEADILAKVHSQAWAQTNLELSAQILIAAKTHSAINENVYEFRLCSRVANIRAHLKKFCRNVLPTDPPT